MILQRLAGAPHGFGELKRAMPRVTAKVLRAQLRQLQADGLVTRRVLTPSTLGVRYQLTPYAKTLNPVFNALLNGARIISSAPGRRTPRASHRRFDRHELTAHHRHGLAR